MIIESSMIFQTLKQQHNTTRRTTRKLLEGCPQPCTFAQATGPSLAVILLILRTLALLRLAQNGTYTNRQVCSRDTLHVKVPEYSCREPGVHEDLRTTWARNPITD